MIKFFRLQKEFKTSGFTLVELLVVISIIGILASIGLFTFSSSQQRARDAARKSDMKNIETALRVYFNDFSTYPTSDATFHIKGCGAAGNTACAWGAAWVVGTNTYMQTVPKDPTSPTVDYRYTYVDADNYLLQACLENSTDPSGIATAGWAACKSGKMFQLKP